MRVALNPFASTIGYLFPYLVSGSIIVSLVLGLPTVGPLLLQALVAQDMFLAGTIVLLLGVLTVIGTFISDLLLMWVDPRIRLRGSSMSADRHAASATAERALRAVATQLAAHLVALPPPQAGGGQPASWSACSIWSSCFADFLAYADPHATDAQRSYIAAAGASTVRRRRASARTSTA